MKDSNSRDRELQEWLKCQMGLEERASNEFMRNKIEGLEDFSKASKYQTNS